MGFVSNSSSSSFLIQGIEIEFDEKPLCFEDLSKFPYKFSKAFVEKAAEIYGAKEKDGYPGERFDDTLKSFGRNCIEDEDGRCFFGTDYDFDYEQFENMTIKQIKEKVSAELSEVIEIPPTEINFFPVSLYYG
jgi:hypothetical protein